MLIELSVPALIALNILAWLLIHLGVAFAITQLSDRHFRSGDWLFRPRPWEDHGQLYRRLLAIDKWKRRLPDGAALFKKGFRKKRLGSRDPAYLGRFRRETCRAETAHWVMLGFGPLFFLWNPPAAAWFNVAYAVLANLPFILTQRYNRFWINELLGDPS